VNLRHFTLSEFDSPDAPGSGRKMDPEFLRTLDTARELAGCPFRITSGYRSVAANRACGGVANSAHLRGLAADIFAPNSQIRYRVLFGLIHAGFQRIGIGPDFIHADCDLSKAPQVTWLY